MNTLKAIIRNISRLGKPVQFLGVENRTPVSEIYGLDRGLPIDRRYIEAFVSSCSSAIRGNIFEIGEKRYAVQFAAQGVPSQSYSTGISDGVDLRIDLADPTSKPSILADCYICTQTLNFVFPLAETVQGLRRCIRPGGKLICTVGGISSLSTYDASRWGHYWGFTPQALKALFSSQEWTDVEIVTYGNYFAAQAFLAGLAVEDLKAPEWLDEKDQKYPVIIGLSATRI